MRITRQHLIRTTIPVLGISAIAITAYSVSSTGSQHADTVIQTEATSAETDVSQPTAQIKVNGNPVSLDANGRASIQTDNGASIDIQSQPPATPGPSPQAEAPTITSVTYSITTGDQTQGETTTSEEGTTKVRIRGNTSTSSSSFSSTTIRNSGDDLVQINESH